MKDLSKKEIEKVKAFVNYWLKINATEEQLNKWLYLYNDEEIAKIVKKLLIIRKRSQK